MVSETKTPELCPHCGKDITKGMSINSQHSPTCPDAPLEELRRNSPWLLDRNGNKRERKGI